ncbi:MAG: winged helix-turn-helix transcriptional regulator [Theionarchaea archaeon]|nr:winged helix-turn-helix transcriptional regulator [Theionarchaea archaeon]
MSHEKFVEELLQTLKHPLRGAILYQLLKGKTTASKIGENLGEKPDRIYYHLKILKENGFIGEPEVKIRKNYLEKYYEISPEFRHTLLSSVKEISQKEQEMSPDEYRGFMLSFLSMVISVLQGYKKRLGIASPEKIEKIREDNNFEVKPIFFTDSVFREWLREARVLSHGSLMDMFTRGASGHLGLIIALPDLDTEENPQN